MKSAGRLLVEAYENWGSFINILRSGSSGTFKFIDGEEHLILEVLPEAKVLVYSFEPRKRRGRALPVADRTSGDQNA
jgi:hypothetical protein